MAPSVRDHEDASADSTQSSTVAVPPELPYSLRNRKKAITFFWTLFVIDTMAQPLILYFCLWYETDLSHNMVFTISTAALGGISVAEYFLRFYALFKKGSTCRPLNHSRRSFLDFFHCNFTIVWLLLAGELIAGTVFEEPLIRLLAMPLPTVMFFFGIVHISLDLLRMMGVKAPFRISSTPKGHEMPTALYPLIEDIIAVDGGGGQEYRKALSKRYHASPYFRHMLFKLNLFWSISAILTATAITISVFMTRRNTAYTLGWVLPFVWAAIATVITVFWVQHDLRKEKELWAKHGGPGIDDGETAIGTGNMRRRVSGAPGESRHMQSLDISRAP